MREAIWQRFVLLLSLSHNYVLCPAKLTSSLEILDGQVGVALPLTYTLSSTLGYLCSRHFVYLAGLRVYLRKKFSLHKSSKVTFKQLQITPNYPVGSE